MSLDAEIEQDMKEVHHYAKRSEEATRGIEVKFKNRLLICISKHVIDNYPREIIKHFNVLTLSSAINDNDWYDTDSFLEHVIFQICSITSPGSKILKKLSRKIKHGEEEQYNLKLIEHGMRKYPDNPQAICYCFESDPLITSLIWSSGFLRDVVRKILELFIRCKSRYSMEDLSYTNIIKQAKVLCHLLSGIRTDRGMKLPRYKGRAKVTLSESAWMKRWKYYCTFIHGMWD